MTRERLNDGHHFKTRAEAWSTFFKTVYSAAPKFDVTADQLKRLPLVAERFKEAYPEPGALLTEGALRRIALISIVAKIRAAKSVAKFHHPTRDFAAAPLQRAACYRRSRSARASSGQRQNRLRPKYKQQALRHRLARTDYNKGQVSAIFA